MNDVVPLPDYLKDCGCKYAPRVHATTCATAIEFDARPRELGVRYAAVSWDYPLTIDARVDITVNLDPALVIAARREEYEAFVPEEGEEWEKPIMFLSHLVEQQLEDIWVTLSHDRRAASDRSDCSDIDIHPEWKPEHTEALDKALGVFVDPNQTALDV